MSVQSSQPRRPALRWIVPVAVAAVAIGAGVVVSGVSADASPALPDRSAAQLLVDLQSARVAGMSGTVVQNAALGFPELPASIGSQGSASFSSLVSGTHTLRVWYAGQDRQRVALLGTLGESDLVRNGADVWAWSSDTNSAEHYQLPAGPTDAAPPEVLAQTPQQLADTALAALDPSTVVTADGTAEVAGRAAYELVLTPRDTASRVAGVRIAIDAEQHVPLRVRVLARGASAPALDVGFTQVAFTTPGAEQFQFSPPPGATVTETPLTQPDVTGPSPAPEVIGTGWTSIAVLTDVALPTDPALLNSLPAVSGAWGSGRLFTSALISALVTDDGRVLVGAVDPQLLYDAAAR